MGQLVSCGRVLAITQRQVNIGQSIRLETFLEQSGIPQLSRRSAHHLRMLQVLPMGADWS